MQKRQKQKTVEQIEKEMRAEVQKIHAAIGKLNQIRRSFKRLDDDAKKMTIFRLVEACASMHQCHEAFDEIIEPLEPLKPKRRRRPTSKQTEDMRAQSMRDIAPLAFSVIQTLFGNRPPVETDPDWPTEIEIDKPEDRA